MEERVGVGDGWGLLSSLLLRLGNVSLGLSVVVLDLSLLGC